MSFDNINVNVCGGQSIIKALQNYNTVILKPNIVDNRNVFTQEMMSERHTKYVIRWNYSLEGATINVPEDCIIEFAGGTIDNGTIVGNNTIMIYNKPIDEVCPAERQGTFIYNTTVADEEDITSESGQLKFKDRPATDGMGRKILRKNIVDGVNTLTQSMIQAANTIYVIQYDFTLGEDITVPANCVLEFDGGSISDGSIDFSNACLIADKVKIFKDIFFLSVPNCEKFFVEWIGIFPNDELLDSAKILKDSNITELSHINLCFNKGTYYFDELYIGSSNTTSSAINFFGESYKQTTGTIFAPFRNLQRYIMKLGGGKDDFGVNLNPKVYDVTIRGISFTNHIDGKRDVTNNTSFTGDDYNCGLLVLDAIQVGHFDVSFAGVINCPAVYIGSLYECEFDFISVYYQEGKSDLPSIQIAPKSHRYINATSIKTLRIEKTYGPIFSGNGCIYEMYIGDLFYEGSQVATQWKTDLTTFSMTSTKDALNDYKACEKIPLFRFNRQYYWYNAFPVTIAINNLSIENANVKWKNTLDGDNLYKAISLCDFTCKAPVYISVKNWTRTLMPYICCEGSNNGFSHSFVVNNFKNETSRGTVITLTYNNEEYNLSSFLPYFITGDGINFSVNNYNNCIADNIPTVITPYENAAFILEQQTTVTGESSSTCPYISKNKFVLSYAQYSLLLTAPIKADRKYVIEVMQTAGTSHSEEFEIRFYSEADESYVSSTNITTEVLPANVETPITFEVPKTDGCYFYIVRKTIGYTFFISRINIRYSHQYVRPNAALIGDMDYDQTRNKPYWYDGSNWIDAEGVMIGYSKSGTFANRPPSTSPSGCTYFCTDKRSPSSSVDGVLIVHKGNDVWVDALGNVIS